jgi:hypothetical protein
MALKKKRKASISGDRSIHVKGLVFWYTLPREIKIKIKIIPQILFLLKWEVGRVPN